MAALAGCAFAIADLAVGNIERLRHVRAQRIVRRAPRPPAGLAGPAGRRWISRRVESGGWCSASSWSAWPPPRPASHWTPVRLALLVVTPMAGASDLRRHLRGHRHGRVLVDRVRRDRQRASPTAASTSPRIRSRSTARCSAGCSPTPSGLPSSPTTRRWCCSTGPIRSARRRWLGYGSPAVGRRGRRHWPALMWRTGVRHYRSTGRRERVHRGARAAQGVHRPREGGPAAPRARASWPRSMAIDLTVERWRDGRLHRAQRRRQVDDTEDAHRRAVPVGGDGAGLRLRAGAAADAAGAAHRCRVRPALAAVVGPAAARLVRRCCATSTGCPPADHAARLARCRGCWSSTPSSTSRCGSSRSASGCAAS